MDFLEFFRAWGEKFYFLEYKKFFQGFRFLKCKEFFFGVDFFYFFDLGLKSASGSPKVYYYFKLLQISSLADLQDRQKETTAITTRVSAST